MKLSPVLHFTPTVTIKVFLALVLLAAICLMADYVGKVDELLEDEYQPIFGGITAFRGQFPWQVALRVDNSYFCGGSLISSQWVLTSAYCAGDNYLIALGTIQFDGKDDGGLVLNAKTTIVHKRFNSSTFNNDIALIKLPTPVNFTPYIQPIRLRYIEEDLTGKILRFSGWGDTSEDNSTAIPLLTFAYLTAITNTECANVYDSIFTPTKICTSNIEDMNTCNGDNGGPLVHLEKDGVYTQVGIGTFLAVVGCDTPYPAGFTRVTSYLDWIESTTGIIIG